MQRANKSVALFNRNSFRSKSLVAATFAFEAIVKAVSLQIAVANGRSNNLSAKTLAARQPASWLRWAHSTTASKVGFRSVLLRGASSSSNCFEVWRCCAVEGVALKPTRANPISRSDLISMVWSL